MKTALFKRIIISVFLQALFALSFFGQKYENGTRLLKGAEVLSATPLQLDYVLENLSDTAKITVNIHEGKTHLVLNDGSGKWHEWWYYMGKWQRKQNGGSSGLENSIQTKHNDGFAGSTLGINEGFIHSLDDTSSDVGINNKNATIRVTPQSMAVMEATKTGASGNITSNIYVEGNETEQNVTWISQNPRKGSRLRMDTTMLEHWQTSTGLDFWNFKSSLPDTTFYIKKRLKFDQPNTSVYIKNGDLRLTDKTGDFALVDMVDKAETDPVWTAVQGNYFTKTALQTSGQSQVHWDNITNKPTMGGGSVTSVGLALPNIFTVTGSPVTTSGTLSATLASQTKNMVFAAPAMTNGVPAFRALQESDIPNLNWNKIYNTPTLLGDYGITNAYTKTETNALLDIPGENCQMLMLFNKRPAVIPRSMVVNQPTHTEFVFSGYDNYPETGSRMLADATGFSFSGNWLTYNTSVDTRSGRLYFRTDNSDNPDYFTNIIMEGGRIYQHANDMDLHANRYSLEIENMEQTKKNTLWSTADNSKFELRKQVGDFNYHTDFKMEDGYLFFSKSIEKDYLVNQRRGFYVGDDFWFDRYLNYSSYDTTLRVLNAVNLSTFEDGDAARIAITDDKDIQFSSTASIGQTEQGSITLTDIIHKGQIITQATEPVIPEGSFAFWVNGSSFYLILRTNGVQKKTQLQ